MPSVRIRRAGLQPRQLAKAMQPVAVDPALSASPTVSLTAAATQMGMVIGTAACMAPEQAKGQAFDRRADIWAFGCALFEMLSGRRVCDARDVSEVLASAIMKEPDLTSLPAGVPASVSRATRGSVKDYAVDLDGQRFLCKRPAVKGDGTPTRLIFVHWTEELKRLVPLP